MLKHFPSISALVVGITLALSVLHEWAYFSVIGSEYMFVMRASDYVAAALKWLPTTLGTILIMLIYEMYMKRVEKGLTEEEIIASSNNPERLRAFRNSPYPVLMVLILITGALYFLFIPGKPLNGPIPIAIYVLWLLFIQWVFSNERMSKKIGELGRVVLIFVPLVLILTASDGLNSAEADLRVTDGKYSVLLTKEKRLDAQFLRSMESGVLLRTPTDKEIVFLPWSQVTKISIAHQNVVSESRACSWFGILCFGEAQKELKPAKSK